MQRRDFSAVMIMGGVVGSAWAIKPVVPASAPTAVLDTEFIKLPNVLPTEAGKVEVVEFFWYGCPHCFAFEAPLTAWVKKLPADVVFKRVPVAFNASFVIHQRLFYTLEALGKVEALHGKVFTSIHTEKQRLDKEEEVLAFATKQGLDGKKFAEVFNSFSVSAKTKQAARLAQSYQIEGVPTLGIQGRYLTSVSQAGSPEHTLEVADELIKRSRKAA